MTARAICLGKFDALHRGHFALAAAAAELGQPVLLRMVGMAAVLGWKPRPPLLFEADRPRVLGEWSQRLGQSVMVQQHPFAALRNLDPPSFIAWVANYLAATAVVTGPDFRFGRGRSGDVSELRRLAAEHHLRVQVVNAVAEGQGPISSTRIRDALAAGDVAIAGQLYGRPHRIAGRVVRGAQRGRSLGFPTANLADLANLAPATGVYAGVAQLPDGARHTCAINIGTLPTIADGGEQSLEVHLLDFSGNLYDCPLIVDFRCRLRDEQRFPNVEALRQQIALDIAAVRANARS